MAILKGEGAKRAAYIKAVVYSIVYSLHQDHVASVLEAFPAVRAARPHVSLHYSAADSRRALAPPRPSRLSASSCRPAAPPPRHVPGATID